MRYPVSTSLDSQVMFSSHPFPVPDPDSTLSVGALLKAALAEGFQFLGHVLSVNLHALDYRIIKVVLLSSFCVFLARDLYLAPTTFYYRYFRPVCIRLYFLAQEVLLKLEELVGVWAPRARVAVQEFYRRYYRKSGSNR